ncbi:hypothetical protein ACIRPQ_03305 [Streptomyces sp. NPDC101213]|uniref:hypothetical protein n=1 Tax=Streptomyces sp. NPDC101213 TaxID=3366130 RepID=UPI003815EC45
MTKFLLAVHVIAAIVAIGPVTVAASMFPPAARRALAAPQDVRAAGTVQLLHRICRVYAAVGITVPVFGFFTGSAMGVLGDAWLIVSIALTVLAAVVLVVLVLPGQEVLVEGHPDTDTDTDTGTDPGTGTGTDQGAVGTVTREATVRLAMSTGIFNLLWATVTVLMIVRPGSTTGA